MQGSVFVVSLKYSPVMLNHARAVGEPLRDAGANVRYLLDDAYAWMLSAGADEADTLPLPGSANPLASLVGFLRAGGRRRLRELFRREPPHTLVFVNLNPLVDRVLLAEARAAQAYVRVVTMLHEPHTADKSVYGWKRAALLHVFEALSRDMANRSDAVILPSQEAREAFRRHYRRFRGSSRVIPLAFADVRCPEELERRYLTFVGHIAHAHQKGLDLFLEMVEASAERPGDWRFQLVTGEDPASVLASLGPRARDRLEVVHAVRLSDEAISRAIRESVAVLILQRRVMQSGVVPMAMMNGTPVIASSLPGLTQFVEDGVTGRIVPVEADLDTRFAAAEAVRDDLAAMSVRCRRYYEETFDSRCMWPHLDWIVGRPGATP